MEKLRVTRDLSHCRTLRRTILLILLGWYKIYVFILIPRTRLTFNILSLIWRLPKVLLVGIPNEEEVKYAPVLIDGIVSLKPHLRILFCLFCLLLSDVVIPS